MLFLLLLTLIAFSQGFVFFERTSYEDILQEMKGARIVYLGEVHDRKDVHELQLKIIRDLFSNKGRILILMEAFQQQFQDALDEYVMCEISEEEMLERTKYRRRWRFDPDLYAPIWRFAKDRSIPLFALNVPSELLREVREKGIRNVKSRYLPKKILPIRKRHKEFLRKALEKHKGRVDEDRFFAIQQVWDSGMAYRIAKLALAHPDATLVVIVGSGHVWRGFGIPERVNYLIGEIPQAVLYVDEDEVHFLFSKDFSKESSSTNSKRDPN